MKTNGAPNLNVIDHMTKRDNAFKYELKIAKRWAQTLSTVHGIAAWPDTLKLQGDNTAYKCAAVSITFPDKRRVWAMIVRKRNLHPLEEHAIKDDRYRAFTELKELIAMLGLTA